MIDDPRNPVRQASSPDDEEQPVKPSGSILDALDMAGTGDIEIRFERPVGHPRPATFD